MLDKDPTAVGLLTLTWAMLIALLGGIVAFLQTHNPVEKKRSIGHHAFNFISQLVISAFAGLLAFYLLAYLMTDDNLIIAGAGIAGHMGGKAIEKIEKLSDLIFKIKS